jgi:hypothetical protein
MAAGCGTTCLPWTVSREKKHRGTRFDGLSRLMVKRIHLQLELGRDGRQTKRAAETRRRWVAALRNEGNISRHGVIS